MRRLMMTVLVLLIASPVLAQPTATPLNQFRWDYETAQIALHQIDRFETCFDAVTPCPSVTPASAVFAPSVAQGGPPAAGFEAYRLTMPALTPGAHTLAVRACNASTCSAPLSLDFTFVIQPPSPTNGQFIPGQ